MTVNKALITGTTALILLVFSIIISTVIHYKTKKELFSSLPDEFSICQMLQKYDADFKYVIKALQDLEKTYGQNNIVTWNSVENVKAFTSKLNLLSNGNIAEELKDHTQEDLFRVQLQYYRRLYQSWILVISTYMYLVFKDFCGMQIDLDEMQLLFRFLNSKELRPRRPIFEFNVEIKQVNGSSINEQVLIADKSFVFKLSDEILEKDLDSNSNINTLLGHAQNCKIRFRDWSADSGFGTSISHIVQGNLDRTGKKQFTVNLNSGAIKLSRSTTKLQIFSKMVKDQNDYNQQIAAISSLSSEEEQKKLIPDTLTAIYKLGVPQRITASVQILDFQAPSIFVISAGNNPVFKSKIQRGIYMRIIKDDGSEEPNTPFFYIKSIEQNGDNINIRVSKLNSNPLNLFKNQTVRFELHRNNLMNAQNKCNEIESFGFPKNKCTSGEITRPHTNDMITVNSSLPRNLSLQDCARACSSSFNCHSLYHNADQCTLFAQTIDKNVSLDKNAKHVIWNLGSNANNYGLYADIDRPTPNNICQAFLPANVSSTFNDCQLRTTASANSSDIVQTLNNKTLSECAAACSDEKNCQAFAYAGRRNENNTITNGFCQMFKNNFGEASVTRSAPGPVNANSQWFTGTFVSSRMYVISLDGLQLKVDGDSRVRLNNGKPIKVEFLSPETVWKRELGRQVMAVNGHLSTSLGHGGWVLWKKAFVENHLDFGWFLRESNTDDKYIIGNDYDGVTYLGYIQNQDSVQILHKHDKIESLWTITPSPPPFTVCGRRMIKTMDNYSFIGARLIGEFYAENYKIINGKPVWKNTAATVHVTDIIGNIKISNDLNGKAYIIGGTGESMVFPEIFLNNSYTMIYVAKYNGPNKGRIFDGLTRPNTPFTNWLTGFWWGNVAKAHHNYWITDPYQDIYPRDNWLIGTDMKKMFRGNGVHIEAPFPDEPMYSPILTVNRGEWPGEKSEWAIACILIYDGELSVTDCKQIEHELFLHYRLDGSNCNRNDISAGASIKEVMRTCLNNGVRMYGKKRINTNASRPTLSVPMASLKDCAASCDTNNQCSTAMFEDTGMCNHFEANAQWDNGQQPSETYLKRQPTNFS
jgi:hypothetical protein